MRLSKEQRKEKILEVATQLFIEKGYHQTTTKEIAQTAGITEPIIYRHFTSKHELFFEVIYKIASKSLDNFVVDDNVEIQEFLEKFIYMHLGAVKEHFKSIKFLFSQILQEDDVKQYYLVTFVPKMVSLISPYLNKINDKKINNYSFAFNMLVLGGIIFSFELAEGLFGFNPEGLTREELSKRLAEVYMRAITIDNKVVV